MKPVKPAKPVKLPPEWIQFYAATGRQGGKATTPAKRKASAENGRAYAEKQRSEKAKLNPDKAGGKG